MLAKIIPLVINTVVEVIVIKTLYNFDIFQIGRQGNETDRRHNRGCNCKRSGCLKNYCECYEAKIPCHEACKCIGCKNVDEDASGG